MNSRILFVFRHPKTVDAMHVFTSPFVGQVWLFIFLIGIFSFVAIRNLFLLENVLTAKSNITTATSNDDSYFNSALFSIGIFFQQGGVKHGLIPQNFKFFIPFT